MSSYMHVTSVKDTILIMGIQTLIVLQYITFRNEEPYKNGESDT